MNLYEDIIGMPHYEPKKHKRMTIENRAAQFAPFAALTGYEEAIIETARTTVKRIEIEEDLLNIINSKLEIIKENVKENPYIKITYFIKDKYKDGGKYEEIEGNIHAIDPVNRWIIFTDKRKINIKDILCIEGRIFDSYIVTDEYE